jgi:predicted phage-related endonuclease
VTVVSLDTRRREKIGGSEAGDACNVGYRGRLMLWYEKVNGIEREDTEAIWLGRALQERVAELVAERDGYEIMPAPADGFTHPEHPWMIVHPDGFTSVNGERAVAEIKTRGTGWHSEDEHELWAYELQVQHGMEVTGLDLGLLVILHGGYGGLRLETRVVERDDDVIAVMMELEKEIVDAVRTQTPPKRLGHRRDSDAIRLMHPESNGRMIRRDREWDEIDKELRARKEQLATVKAQVAELENAYKVRLGDFERCISPHDTRPAKWATREVTRIDTTALKAARPEIASEFAVTKPERRFTLE